jgi:hypothetical protein
MTIRDWREFTTEPADELRELILEEFAKPEFPAPIDLFRICERYMVRLFDIEAEKRAEEPHAEYVRGLENMIENLPRMTFRAPTGPFNLAIQRAMLAFVDHGGKPSRTDEDFMPYLNMGASEIFFNYALRSRREYWAAWHLNHSEPAPAAATSENDERIPITPAVTSAATSARTPLEKRRPRMTKETVAKKPTLERVISGETVQERAVRRQAAIDPLLKKATLYSINSWEIQAGVKNKTGRRYYDGVTLMPTEETLKQLARPLGVHHTDLPL